MPNPLTLGYSDISSKIYAGRSKQAKGMREGVRVFTGDKVDVTSEALSCVADKIVNDGVPVQWILDDGRIMTLRVEITDPE